MNISMLSNIWRYIDHCKTYIPSTKNYYLDPRPLVTSKDNIAISWSAKSASAQILMWYLAVEGLLTEAMDYSEWPHRYREQILYIKPEYRSSLTALIRSRGNGWKLIKVMRCPLRRLVSSYQHTMRFGYANSVMSEVLGRKICNQEGFSIATFLEFLKRIDIAKCDMHFRSQINPVDHLRFSERFIINIDSVDLFKKLNKVEQHLGIIREKFEDTQYSINIEERHHSKQSSNLTNEELFNKVFNFNEAIGEWPGSQLRKLQEVKEAAAEIYSQDYDFLKQIEPSL